jgi:hypothetical protein
MNWTDPPPKPTSRSVTPASRWWPSIDDYPAFGQMMLKTGKRGNERILSRLSVETMTTDQLTPEQKAVSGFWDNRGWGGTAGVGNMNRQGPVAHSTSGRWAPCPRCPRRAHVAGADLAHLAVARGDLDARIQVDDVLPARRGAGCQSRS